MGAIVALAVSASASAPAPVPPAVLTAQDIGTRLRVFARPGDFKLSNRAITAVVRKRDGWLTELWRNGPVLPTVEQLGTTTDIDALWQLYPVARLGKKDYPVLAARVGVTADAIEVEGVADTPVGKIRALTRYRMHPTEPRLTMTTRFSVDGGAAVGGGLGLGDAFKWGNVRYYVEGVWPPRMKYKGRARWIGRRGAGGDLLLRPLGKGSMWVDYTARIRGFQSTITTLYDKSGIPAGGSVTVTRELSFEELSLPERKLGPTGTLEARLSDENGNPLPAKLRIDSLGSKKPLFDDNGGLDGTDRFAWTGNGVLTRALPPGRYQLLATAGIERDAARGSVLIRAGKTARFEAKLPRVIDTPGWISGDLHLHQAPSVDADISLPARVVAIAAEGVELGVATDHYVVTDLAPTVTWLRTRGVLTGNVVTIPGSEVSTLGSRFGHFNVFPLSTRDNVRYQSTTPKGLFDDAKKKSPNGILQVNHPRWDPALGYFSYFGIDDDTGEMTRPGYDPRFDTIEVYNGDDARDLKKVERVLLDWIHLLGRGGRYTATGSSDSHNLAFLDPGLPRTLIHWGSAKSDAQDLSAPQKSVISALRAGHAIVTSGPILDVTVNGKGPGETVQSVGNKAHVHVVVKAAPWIDVRAVEILVGGAARKAHFALVPRKNAVVRLDRTFDVPVTDKTFVIVTARGDRGLPNASREGTMPFAFTNPIWLDP